MRVRMDVLKPPPASWHGKGTRKEERKRKNDEKHKSPTLAETEGEVSD